MRSIGRNILKNSPWIEVFIFFVLSLLVVSIWFKEGTLFATAEEGMRFYSPKRSVLLYSSVWQKVGTGQLVSIVLPRLPLMHFANTLGSFFETYVTQAIVFGMLIFSGVFGMFLLSNKLIKNRLISLIASVFYFLNLYSMSQVWARSLSGGMFSWAYLPLFLYLWINWLREGSVKWLVAFLVSSFIFVHAFSTPASMFTYWIPAGLFVIVEIWLRRKRGKIYLPVLLKSFLAVVLWLFISFWWIYPYINLSESIFSLISSTKLNFESLRGVSTNFPVSQIVQLRQKFYFNSESNKELWWGTWYENPLAIFTTWLGFGLVIVGWFYLRKRRTWLFLTSLTLVALFISKGTNPPLGFTFFKWLFSTFPFTAALRNSYEKFGIAFLLPYSIFFGGGVYWLVLKLGSLRNKLLLLSSTVFLFFGVLVWPMWTGDVFQDYSWIRVPEYYKDANDLINMDNTDSRILMTPMIPDHGLRYTWGYIGDEPSRFLFDKTSVSKYARSKYYGDKYLELKDAFENRKNYSQILQEMNIKYLVLHNDLNWEPIGASSPAQAKLAIEGNGEIQFLREFGELEIYEFTQEQPFSLFVAEGENKPTLNYKKTDGADYMVNIQNAEEPYTLIFKETFNDSWEAKIDGQKVGEHFLVYDYANGWRIDKVGDYSVDVILKVWPWE